jgi:hypothetical protein
MIPRFINTLKEWRVASPPMGNLVFLGLRSGKPRSCTGLQDAFLKVQRAAGLLDAAGRPKYCRHVHALRYSFARGKLSSTFRRNGFDN